MNVKYLVIEMDDIEMNYVVDDLDELIKEVYEVELLNGESEDNVKKYFNNNFKVFKVKGEIEELN